jgi:hypothetical protein
LSVVRHVISCDAFPMSRHVGGFQVVRYVK